MKHKFTLSLAALSLSAFSTLASAGSITCGSTQRTATLDSAEVCEIGTGNTQNSDIDTHFGGTWTQQGSLTSNGSNGYLSTNLTSGSWGSSPIAGTWGIDSSFWSTFDDAVISIHVGNGGGDPDHFAWSITDLATDGTWAYEILSGSGGGLSNMKLWGRGVAQPVPVPSTFALFGLGLLGLAAARKKLSA